MTNFKNPFKPGDVLWYELNGVPFVFYNVLRDDMVREVGKIGVESLEVVICKYQGKAAGPYQLLYRHDWGRYDFGLE